MQRKQHLIQSVFLKKNDNNNNSSMIGVHTLKLIQVTYCFSVLDGSVKTVGRTLVIFLCIIIDTVNSSKVNGNTREQKMEILDVFELFYDMKIKFNSNNILQCEK